MWRLLWESQGGARLLRQCWWMSLGSGGCQGLGELATIQAVLASGVGSGDEGNGGSVS